MALKPCSGIGSYEVVPAIGDVGTGEVYRARGIRGSTATKVLTDLFARDPERPARFEREARTCTESRVARRNRSPPVNPTCQARPAGRTPSGRAVPTEPAS